MKRSLSNGVGFGVDEVGTRVSYGGSGDNPKCGRHEPRNHQHHGYWGSLYMREGRGAAKHITLSQSQQEIHDVDW